MWKQNENLLEEEDYRVKIRELIQGLETERERVCRRMRAGTFQSPELQNVQGNTVNDSVGK